MSSDLPNLLRAIERGEAKASEELLPLVYAELRSLASRQLARERVGATLQATALVHEAYLRLIGGEPAEKKWDGIGHFYAAAAESIRRILVERARARAALKRGGDRERVTLGPEVSADEVDRDQLLDLDAALRALAEEDPRKARLVELRYFAGLSLGEVAEVLGISPATADRDWAYARAWLHDRLSAERRSSPSG
ncbi:MAG: sigma-70 family RNA polymerase sigma factor [Planctomycetes bacterium]|nr:sigma-70 family RNA polymerase sigma factor [Planctomycetota bacterium]